MDPDIVRQLNDQIKEMTDLLSKQNAAMAAQIKAANAAAGAATTQVNETKRMSSAQEGEGAAVTGNTAKSQAAAKATELVNAASAQFSKSLSSGKSAILSFASAVLDATPGVSKYTGSIKGVTDTIGGVASILGPLGGVVRGLMGVLGEVAGEALLYSDNVVKTFDSIAKSGAGLGQSAENLMNLARGAGLSSKTANLLTKGVSDLGPNIRSLGKTSSEGVNTFGRMLAVGEHNLQGYRKLGYTQERLIESQTKFIELQAQAGANMRKSPEDLQKASLAYIDNLNKLSELTGLNEEKQQELLAQAQAQENFNAHITDLETEKARAEKLGDTVKAQEIDNIIQAKKNYAMFAQQFSPEKATAILETISSKEDPTITDSNSAIVRGMPELLDQARKLNKGYDQVPELIEATGRSVDNFNAMSGDAASNMGEASRERMKAYGQDNEGRAMRARYQGKSREELAAEGKRLQKEQDDKKNQQSGIMAQRAAVEAQERQLRQTFDTVMAQLAQVLNDMILKFIPMVTKALQFIVAHREEIESAAKALAIAFAALGGVALLGKAVGIVRSAKEKITKFFKGEYGRVGSSTNPAYVKLSGGSGLLGSVSGQPASGTDGDGPDTDQEGSIGGVVKSLKKASRHAVDIIKGGAALGTGLALIGGGAAAAVWIVGKAMPTFAEGLKSFNKIDGPNLKDVGLGMLGLSGGILLFSGGSIVTGLNTLISGGDPLETAGESLLKFQKLPIDPEAVAERGEAVIIFAKAMSAATGLDAFAKVASGIASFFKNEPPFKKFEDFSKLKIDAKKVKNNATAFKYFAEAMGSYSGSGIVGRLSGILSDAVTQHFKVELPIDKFVYFAKQKIDPKQTKINATAFKYFSEAMSTYKGTGAGMITALNQLAGGVIRSLLGTKGPVEAFLDFTKMSFGSNGAANAKAFLDFATAIGILTGGSGNTDSSYTPGPSGSPSVPTPAPKPTPIQLKGNAQLIYSEARKRGYDHFMAISFVALSQKETGLNPRQGENLNYSAKGIMDTWKGTPPDVAKRLAAGGPVAIANYFYANVSGNQGGNDGWNFRGRGFNGITGKQTYKDVGKRIGVDIYSNPDALYDPKLAAAAMFAYFDMHPLTKGKKSADSQFAANALLTDANAGLKRGWYQGSKFGIKNFNRVQQFASDWANAGLKAKVGGTFTGPTSGYMIELHGTEMIIPISSDSLLKILSQPIESTSDAARVSEAFQEAVDPFGKSSPPTSMKKIIEIDNDMREALLAKFNRMLSILDDRHSTSQKQYRHVVSG